MGGLRTPPAPRLLAVLRRLPGHRGHPALLGLLQQGRDPGHRARRRARSARCCGVVGIARRRPDRLLHVPALLPRLLRPRAARAATAHPHDAGWAMAVPVVDARRAAPPSAAGSRCRARWQPVQRLARAGPADRRPRPRGRPTADGVARRIIERSSPLAVGIAPRLVDLRGRPGRAACAWPARPPARAPLLARPVPLRRRLRGRASSSPAATSATCSPTRVERVGRAGLAGGSPRAAVVHDSAAGCAPLQSGPRAHLRVRDGRRRRGRRRHLQPGGAADAVGLRHRPAAPARGARRCSSCRRGAAGRRAGAHLVALVTVGRHARARRRSWSGSSTAAAAPAVRRPRRLGRAGRPVVGRRRGRHLAVAAAADRGALLPRHRRRLLAPPERPRAFLAMLLLAEGGLLGLFAAGDLVLFYVFWEAMLVPFYFLIGMWGGEGRGPGHDHVRDLHDGRQPADAGRRSWRRPSSRGTSPASSPSHPRRSPASASPTPRAPGCSSGSPWRSRSSCRSGPFHGWLPRRLPHRADPGDRAAGGGDEQGRRLRLPAHRRAACSPRAPTASPSRSACSR